MTLEKPSNAKECDHKFIDSKNCLKCGKGYDDLLIENLRERGEHWKQTAEFQSGKRAEAEARVRELEGQNAELQFQLEKKAEMLGNAAKDRRELEAERDGLLEERTAEIEWRLALRKELGATDAETFPDFVRRLARLGKFDLETAQQTEKRALQYAGEVDRLRLLVADAKAALELAELYIGKDVRSTYEQAKAERASPTPAGPTLADEVAVWRSTAFGLEEAIVKWYESAGKGLGNHEERELERIALAAYKRDRGEAVVGQSKGEP